MMRSLFSGVAGLKNHQTRMDVIGNNISNVNTTGFKSSRVNFTDMLSQNLQGASSPNGNMGGTNPKQVGLGSAVGAVDLLFTNGSVQSTGVNTDLALSSTNALFILNTGNGTAYTRNGDFQFDADGNYVQAGNGYFVQGWMANNGTIDTGSKVTNITIPSGKTMSPTASTLATYTNNLNAEVPTIVKMAGGAPVDDKTYDTREAGIFSASSGAPLKLVLSSGGDPITVVDGDYSVGDAYPAATTTQESDMVVVSEENSPVLATLEDGRVLTASESGTGWKFGFTTNTDGYSETASATKEITLIPALGTPIQGKTGETYTVGDTYMGDEIAGSVAATGDTENNIITLVLDDGSTHDVSAKGTPLAPEIYNINDLFTYTDSSGQVLDARIRGYKQGFKINSMMVVSPSGTGATIADKTQGGVASRTLDSTTTDKSATASTENTVTLTLENGDTHVLTDGKTYTVGGEYESAEEPAATGAEWTGAAGPTNRIRLYLSDNTTVDDAKSGKNYKVGGTYAKLTSSILYETLGDPSPAASATNRIHVFTSNGDYYDDSSAAGTYVVGDPDPQGATIYYFTEEKYTNYNIDGFTKISQIETIKEESKIAQVTETVNPTITAITTSKNGATADSPLTLTLSDGSTLVQTSGTYATGQSLPVVTTLAVYDTLGSVHELPVYFTLMDASTDTWSVALTPDGSTTTSWQEADGSTTTVSMPPVTLDFDTNGAFASGTGTTTLTMTNGSTTPQTVQLDFTQLTQYSSSSTIAGKANGNASGSLSSISIDKTGTITGTYTNGEKQVEAQVALQRFTNPGGLNKIGESLYEDSNNAGLSGSPNTAAALGATITPSALEMSNVDVANEFTDMIITQRGFQSNSKIITTSDEMLETLINLKR